MPVALATDDEGVARSDMTREYERAVLDQGLGYVQLKTMARAGLEHAFIEGASLWSDGRRFTPVAACPGDTAAAGSPCRAYLDRSARARLQWDLERAFDNIFSRLRIKGTRATVEKFVKPKPATPRLPEHLAAVLA